MNNIILCEGVTDFTLLQYYMRKVYKWGDSGGYKFRYKNEKARVLKRDNSYLTIASVGGVSNLIDAFENVLERNEISSPINPDELFNRIVIFTDNDEHDTMTIWKNEIKKICSSRGYVQALDNDQIYTYIDKSNQTKQVEIILVIVPFDEEGALETFMLNCVSKKDVYDKQIVEEAYSFVENVDYENRYLNSRRLRLKAKFDVYFSVRTSAKQFQERQDILKGIEWEKYIDKNSLFKVFEGLD